MKLLKDHNMPIIQFHSTKPRGRIFNNLSYQLFEDMYEVQSKTKALSRNL